MADINPLDLLREELDNDDVYINIIVDKNKSKCNTQNSSDIGCPVF